MSGSMPFIRLFSNALDIRTDGNTMALGMGELPGSHGQPAMLATFGGAGVGLAEEQPSTSLRGFLPPPSAALHLAV